MHVLEKLIAYGALPITVSGNPMLLHLFFLFVWLLVFLSIREVFQRINKLL